MKVTLIMAMTVDGRIARKPDEFVDWTPREDKRHFMRTTKGMGALIMGRGTYDIHAKPLPGRLNVIMTRDASRQRENQPGVLEFTDAEPEDIVRDLEQRGFSRVALAGGARINGLFLRAGLIHEIRLTVVPRLFGNGVPLFSDAAVDASLELVSSEPLGDSLLLTYRVITPAHGSTH